MMLFLPFIAKHTWLAPVSHFTTSAVAGYIAYFIGESLFKTEKTAIAFGIFVAVGTHIFFDLLGWF